jgi:hypothetical protein
MNTNVEVKHSITLINKEVYMKYILTVIQIIIKSK